MHTDTLRHFRLLLHRFDRTEMSQPSRFERRRDGDVGSFDWSSISRCRLLPSAGLSFFPFHGVTEIETSGLDPSALDHVSAIAYPPDGTTPIRGTAVPFL